MSIINRAFYSDTIEKFLKTNNDQIIGKLSQSEFGAEPKQVTAWIEEIHVLKQILIEYKGSIYFEFSIPRMGKRVDVILVIANVIFVLEFKTGDSEFTTQALDQVWDYALDLKNFHETSHDCLISPILITSKISKLYLIDEISAKRDKLLNPITITPQQLPIAIKQVLQFAGESKIDLKRWENGSYKPTPTIVEAAMALYNNHSVDDITRSEAGITIFA